MRIEFFGYKRLMDTGCNVDDRLVAFLGPNEAGKTSVLKALAWLDAPGVDPLPPNMASRGQEPSVRKDDDEIVRAVYRLNPSDWEKLDGLPFLRTDDDYRYVYARERTGLRVHELHPNLLRDPAPFVAARRALTRAPRSMRQIIEAGAAEFENGDLDIDIAATYADLMNIVEQPETEGTEALVAGMRAFSEWLAGAEGGEPKASTREAAERVADLATVLDAEHPHQQALDRLEAIRPKFREFGEQDRRLENEFDTNQDDDSMSLALSRILSMAGTNMNHLRSLWVDESARDTFLEAANETLTEIFGRAWSQSNLAIRLKAEQNLLKVQVKVVENGRTYYSTFGERSDGLKAFVTLVAFLYSLPEGVPPVLLIDEAELHLHIDAQADLIQVLQEKIQTTQVFYSTHSPGCLPMDLGRGLRFVEPTDEHYSSEILQNFWVSRYPGFSAVLFKMGAAAFAFSALRNAVLAEGPSDMILLPRLIRLALEVDALPYQIAPRLNDLDEEQFGRDDIAAHVVYLADGDRSGRESLANQQSMHGVPANLLVAHPNGYAVEDYVDVAQLLGVVNDLRTDPKRGTVPIVASQLPEGETIAQRITRWFGARGIHGPGKIAVATRLVNMDDLKLRSGSKTRLQGLHDRLVVALANRPPS